MSTSRRGGKRKERASPLPCGVGAGVCTDLRELKKLLPRRKSRGYNRPHRPYLIPKRGECLIRVKVRMNESLDQLLKRFKKACEKEGLTRDIKRTAFYEKPSEKRRRQERQLIRKMQKEANLGR